MRHATRIAFQRCFRFAVYSCLAVAAICARQTPTNGDEAKLPQSSGSPFELGDLKSVQCVRRLREVAINDCVAVLERRKEGRLVDPGNTLAIRAAELLGELRANHDIPIRVLCSNIQLQSNEAGETGSLSAFPAANALAEIGTAQVSSEIIRLLDQELEREALLLCARILEAIDERDITIMRLEKHTQKGGPDKSSESLRRNASVILKWLNDKEFPQDPKYWP